MLAGTLVRAQALPLPTNQNLTWFGYYGAMTKYGDYTSQVYPYTNLDVIGPYGAADTEDSDWQTPYYDMLDTAASNGKTIMLITGPGTAVQGNQTITPEDSLEIASDFWSSIAMINMLDDVPETASAEAVEESIDDFLEILNESAPSAKPIMAQFTFDGALEGDGIEASNLDIVGVTAFKCGNGEQVVDNVDELLDDLNTAKGRIATAGKQAILTMMAFDRNIGSNSGPGPCPNWTWNVQSLTAMQEAYYAAAYASEGGSNPVVGISMFVWTRPGSGFNAGTINYPGLQIRHWRIGAVMGIPVMQNNATVAQCSNYVLLDPVSKGSAAQCYSHCLEKNADGCEFDSGNSDCYAIYGNACEVGSGPSGNYAAVLNMGQMQADSGVGGCEDWTWLSPVTIATANQCLSWCVDNDADACEWNSGSNECYAEYGNRCHVYPGANGWHATVLKNSPAFGG
jgi:hypothetical protein